MKLINMDKNTDDEYFDVEHYHFEKATSTTDIYSVINFLQEKGYDFYNYVVRFEHDHTEDLEVLIHDNIESLLNSLRDVKIQNIDSIELYGNITGTFFPNEGRVNIVIKKNTQGRTLR